MPELNNPPTPSDEELRAFVPDVKFELIKIKNLVPNQHYQRNLSLSLVSRTADNFDGRDSFVLMTEIISFHYTLV